MVAIFKMLRQAVTGFRPVSHVIFDIDGLLLRTEEIYYRIDKSVIEKYGREYPWNVRLKALGRSEMESAEIIVKECGLPISPKEYHKEVKELQKTLLKEATLMPGAERLVHHLFKHKVPMAVATSSGAESVAAKTTNHKELFSLFQHIVMASSDSEVKRGKPAPDIFLVCAKRFCDKPDPSKCLVFEDAPNGVKAAKDAGMQVVLVPDSKINEEDKKQPTLLLDSLMDFKPELFSLPKFP